MMICERLPVSGFLSCETMWQENTATENKPSKSRQRLEIMKITPTRIHPLLSSISEQPFMVCNAASRVTLITEMT